MCIDHVPREIVDQVGFEDYRFSSNIERKESQTGREDLIYLLGVLVGVEDCDP